MKMYGLSKWTLCVLAAAALSCGNGKGGAANTGTAEPARDAETTRTEAAQAAAEAAPEAAVAEAAPDQAVQVPAAAAGAVSAAAPSAAAAAKVEVQPFAAAVERRAFESDLIAGSAVAAEEDLARLDLWAEALEKAGELEAGITRLEQAAGGREAPPAVTLALAVLYGRKGLAAKQYAALEKAEAAAQARPEASFQLALIHGRKEILKNRYTIDQLIPGSIRVVSSPPGARVWINGEERGTAPLSAEAMAGSYRVRLELSDHQATEHAAEVRGGLATAVEAALKPLPGRCRIESEPAGATITLGGIVRGTTPATVELEPAVRHALRISRQGYRPYAADLTLEPNREQVVAARLEPLPASLKLDSVPPGANVLLNGEGNFFILPHTFENLAPGKHRVEVKPVLWNDRFYGLEQVLEVDLKPGESATLAPRLVPMKASLLLIDPRDMTLYVNGMRFDGRTLAAAADKGIEVPAEKSELRLVSSGGQEWTHTATLWPGTPPNYLSRNNMTYVVPRRTIAIDGKVDDWGGLEPAWFIATPPDRYPNQYGTALSRGYICRDDRYLYYRIDFADGSPTPRLSADFPQRLVYQIAIAVDKSEQIYLEVFFDRSSGANVNAGIYNNISRTGSSLETTGITYKIGEGTMEVRASYGSIKRLIGSIPRKVWVYVAKADSKGKWETNNMSPTVSVFHGD